MNYDQKQFLDLLQEYKSEDTKKARRNLTTVAFIVIAVWLLQIHITEVKVLGVDLSHTSETFVLVLALVLLIYWAVMFYLSLTHDYEIQKERAYQLNDVISAAEKRQGEIVKSIENSSAGAGYYASERGELKKIIDAYSRQKERTAKASKYAGLIKAIETWLPACLAIWAALILVVGLVVSLG